VIMCLNAWEQGGIGVSRISLREGPSVPSFPFRGLGQSPSGWGFDVLPPEIFFEV